MGAITSYQCDGDGCVELVEKPKGNQYPPLDVWDRITVKVGGKEHVGAVHNAACAMSFVDKVYADREIAEAPEIED